MASRSSGMYASENYVGTRRGRSTTGDMGWEMHPEKLEQTEMYFDPESVDDMQRDTLRDFSPDTVGLFEDAAPRRNTHSAAFLSLRENGARVATEPWQNEDYDTQFHDHDPRGYSTEQPWAEYRRQQIANMRRSDFRNDGDMSIPETGISPYTMYSMIRSAQNWTKARLKIFETSLENMHPGGVGVYANVSNVFKSDVNDGTVNVDQLAYGDEAPQHTTTHLSNVVHQGSAALRANTTTDHRVAVSAYGKLYANNGLMKHESQLRSVEDDTPRQRAHADQQLRSLSRLMSSYVDGSAATGVRRAMQDAAASGDLEKFAGARESVDQNRSMALSRDVMALFGFVEQDIKNLRTLEQTNASAAAPLVANLYHLTEMLHKLPANAKLEMRNELLLRSAGGGLRSGDSVLNRYRVDVNPKLVQFMDVQIRSQAPAGDGIAALYESTVDEGKYVALPSDAFVLRKLGSSGDATLNLYQARTDGRASESKVAASYSALAKSAIKPNSVGRSDGRTAVSGDAAINQHRAPALRSNTDMYRAATEGVAHDVEFQDTGALRRSNGRHGIKSRARRHQLSERVFDEMADGDQTTRK